MALRSLSSFIPIADELLNLDLPRLGGILLLHLKSYEGLNTVSQNGRLNRDYFIAMLENRNVGLGALPHKDPHRESTNHVLQADLSQPIARSLLAPRMNAGGSFASSVAISSQTF